MSDDRRIGSSGQLYGDPDGIYARVIAYSISTRGIELTTMEIQCHRFVLAEFNTHRKFSRNSASSRAIPFPKQLARVRENPAVPLSFPAEQKGMQGGEELTDDQRFLAQRSWLAARDDAARHAEYLHGLGVHKSVVNRLLEPFMWHKIIVSSTEWDNFFAQRCSPLAQPEIRAVAELMREAHEAAVPRPLKPGEWHLPYIQEEDWEAASKLVELGVSMYPILTQVSAARCARVSYLTQDGKRDLEVDMELYRRLTEADPPHWSPLEHVATPSAFTPAPSNFDGWDQLRQLSVLMGAVDWAPAVDPDLPPPGWGEDS